MGLLCDSLLSETKVGTLTVKGESKRDESDKRCQGKRARKSKKKCGEIIKPREKEREEEREREREKEGVRVCWRVGNGESVRERGSKPGCHSAGNKLILYF